MANWPDLPDLEPYEPGTFEQRYTGTETIQLVELMREGVFSWDTEPMQGAFLGLGADNAARLEAAFLDRFKYEEIAMLPPGRWMHYLRSRIVHEVVPKYKPLYDARALGDFNPTQAGSEWHKERTVHSEFPETQISGNSDYLSDGTDREHQTIRTGDQIELSTLYYETYKDIDKAVLDELDSMFAGLFSVQVNAW